MRGLLVVLLLAGPLLGQAGPTVIGPCKMDGSDCSSSGSGVSGLTSGRVTLSTGATTVGDDAGLTGVGTGTGFKLGIGTDVFVGRSSAGVLRVVDGSDNYAGLRVSYAGFTAAGTGNERYWIGTGGLETRMGSGWKQAWNSGADFTTGVVDLALSRASAGTLLIEDGSGAARDVQARTGTFGTSVVTPAVSFSSTAGLISAYSTGGYLTFTDYVVGARALNLYAGNWYPGSDNTQDLGVDGATWRYGRFGTSVISPTHTSGLGKSGTNVAGTNNVIQAEPGTGSATGSSIILQTPTAGASGTTAQAHATRVTINESGVGIGTTPISPLTVMGDGTNFGITIWDPGAGATYKAHLSVDNAGNGWLSTDFAPLFVSAGNATPIYLRTDGVTRLTVEPTTGVTAVTAPLRLAGYTVATLPAGTVGDTAYVTDALAPAFGVALVGGGAVVIPAFYDGANWIAH